MPAPSFIAVPSTSRENDNSTATKNSILTNRFTDIYALKSDIEQLVAAVSYYFYYFFCK